MLSWDRPGSTRLCSTSSPAYSSIAHGSQPVELLLRHRPEPNLASRLVLALVAREPELAVELLQLLDVHPACGGG